MAELTLETSVWGVKKVSDVFGPQLVSDVKCYFCGHVSGQIIAQRNQPLRLNNFVPREGYTGPELKLGGKLRCERCKGPVFLEDVGPVATQRIDNEKALRRRLDLSARDAA